MAGVVTKTHYHHLGNLLLTFVLFWTYVSFGQLLIIYSGDFNLAGLGGKLDGLAEEDVLGRGSIAGLLPLGEELLGEDAPIAT